MYLARTAYVHAQMCICVTIFSYGSIIQTGFKVTELHALIQVTHSYVPLCVVIVLYQSKQVSLSTQGRTQT